MTKLKCISYNAACLSISLLLSLFTAEIPLLFNLSAPVYLLFSNKTDLKLSIYSYIIFSALNIILKINTLILLPYVIFDILFMSLLMAFIHKLRLSPYDWKYVILLYNLITYYSIVIIISCITAFQHIIVYSFTVLFHYSLLLFVLQIFNITVPLIVAFLGLYFLSIKMQRIVVRLENSLV